MARFRKKPIEIEAVPVAEVLAVNDGPLAPKLPAWVLAALEPDPETDEGHGPDTPMLSLEDEEVYVRTSEGTMIGNFDDWLIRGVKGELYPCKPDIFEATYERVGERPDIDQADAAGLT